VAVASMGVTFGWHLDARHGPLLDSRFGAPVVGRFGLLGLLELYLGLAGPPFTRSQRVAAYLGCLRAADDGKRFYSKSLEADEMGVASELLNWRDEWLLYGWDGTAPAEASKRVADLAQVEASARAHVPPGEAERLERVATALTSRAVPISEVRVVDDMDRMPKRWRAVLERLPHRVDSIVTPAALDQNGTLARLQLAALTSSAAGKVEALAEVVDDGSVQIYRADSSDVAVHWLGVRKFDAPTDQTLICEQDGSELDDIFRATGKPVCGFDKLSAYRPALQALPLALELLWKPADVHRVLEFLVHPYGPIKRQARRLLARAYAAQPGYGGEEWKAAKAAIKGLNAGDELVREVEFWFEGEHWARDVGPPLPAVEVRVDRVVTTLRSFMATPRDDAAAIGGGIRQGQAFLDGLAELKAQGLERLTPRHVEQLLVQSTVAGAGNPYAEPEVGCGRSATSAALAGLEPAKEVVWWMPSKPTLPQPHPWSLAEIASLKQAGAELRDTAAELNALAKDWLRPLLAAQERFVLVLPPVTEEEHPIWLLVRRLLPTLPVRHIETELAESAHTDTVADKPLPGLNRYLHIPADMTSRRTRQSFTSLADLFDNPAVSVLKDASAFRGATLMAVEDERRLLGTLAHRLVEKLFAVQGVLAWDAAAVRAWFDLHGEALIEAEGAPLLMLGFGIVLHRFRGTVRDSTAALLQHLQSAGTISVRTEVEYEGALFGVPVIGTVDLLAEFPDKRLALLDLKWSGEKRYRDRLLSGTHLQLAIYASLVEQNVKVAPVELAFYIFDSRGLLATSNSVFPNAQVCAPPPDSSVPQLLKKAEASWKWRQGQLAGGELEVVDLRLADIEDFQGPPGTLPVRESGPWNDELLALLGWEEGA
jgi:hypothetical protein